MSTRDPFTLNSGFFGGLKIVESPDRPKYTLPAEVCPDVPWPKGFREEINAWALGFFGTTNIVPRGMAYVIGGNYAVMRPQAAAMLINLAC